MINHHSSKIQDIIIMFIIMIIAGILSGMNIFANNISDVRLQLNDVYMGALMTGWMFLLLGFFYSMNNYIYIGVTTILILIYLIRNQVFIGQKEFIDSMIPHHSMAIFMSSKLKEKNIITNQELNNLVNDIINTQQKEINFMKSI